MTCRDCGIAFDDIPHCSRGYCAACYQWHRRHGWDASRPPTPTHCLVCRRSFAHLRRTRGLCHACYVYAIRPPASQRVTRRRVIQEETGHAATS